MGTTEIAARKAMTTDSEEHAERERYDHESKRLDWLLMHQSAECDRHHAGDYYLTSWLGGSEVGNQRGSGGVFIARGASPRECIDKFLLGDVKPID